MTAPRMNVNPGGPIVGRVGLARQDPHSRTARSLGYLIITPKGIRDVSRLSITILTGVAL